MGKGIPLRRTGRARRRHRRPRRPLASATPWPNSAENGRSKAAWCAASSEIGFSGAPQGGNVPALFFLWCRCASSRFAPFPSRSTASHQSLRGSARHRRPPLLSRRKKGRKDAVCTFFFFFFFFFFIVCGFRSVVASMSTDPSLVPHGKGTPVLRPVLSSTAGPRPAARLESRAGGPASAGPPIRHGRGRPPSPTGRSIVRPRLFHALGTGRWWPREGSQMASASFAKTTPKKRSPRRRRNRGLFLLPLLRLRLHRRPPLAPFPSASVFLLGVAPPATTTRGRAARHAVVSSGVRSIAAWDAAVGERGGRPTGSEDAASSRGGGGGVDFPLRSGGSVEWRDDVGTALEAHSRHATTMEDGRAGKKGKKGSRRPTWIG